MSKERANLVLWDPLVTIIILLLFLCQQNASLMERLLNVVLEAWDAPSAICLEEAVKSVNPQLLLLFSRLKLHTRTIFGLGANVNPEPASLVAWVF